MNTQTVTNVHKDAFLSGLMQLLFGDGFGFHEVLTNEENLAAYSRAIFGSDTPTGRLRVKEGLSHLQRINYDH